MGLRLSQRPLTASSADAELFVDRRGDRERVHRALRLGLNVLLLGERGSGRTSMLRTFEQELGGRALYVDAQPWEGTTELATRLRGAFGDVLLSIGALLGSEPEPALEPDPASVLHQSPAGYRWVRKPNRSEFNEVDARRLVDAARHAPDEEARVVLLDGARPAQVHTLFGRFRDVLWEAPVQWVVTGEPRFRHECLRPPADTFFESVVELEPLSDEQAAEVLRRRLAAAGDDADAQRLGGLLDQLVAGLEERTPRAVLAAARSALLAGDSPESALRRHADAHTRAAALGRNAAMVYAEMESLGPVHAGDERLLGRLGYSRARVVQLLKELEQAGLVTSRREGRRVLYATVASGGARG